MIRPPDHRKFPVARKENLPEQASDDQDANSQHWSEAPLPKSVGTEETRDDKQPANELTIQSEISPSATSVAGEVDLKIPDVVTPPDSSETGSGRNFSTGPLDDDLEPTAGSTTPDFAPEQMVGVPIFTLPASYRDELPADDSASLHAGEELTTASALILSLPSSASSPQFQRPTPDEASEPSLPFRPWNPEVARKLVMSFRSATFLTLALLGVGVLGGYFFPHPEVPQKQMIPKAVPQEDAIPLTSADQDNLDAAYAARKAGKYLEAGQLFASLAGQRPNWGSVEIEIGQTHLYEKDLSAAQVYLRTLLNKGIMPADASFYLALLSILRKDFGAAESNFAKAVAFDQTRPEFYYFWGECLRDEGKPREAASKYRSALLRNQFENSEGLYRLKLWLSEIEISKEHAEAVGVEVDALLLLPRPPLEALFAAAARALKAGDIPGSASRLRRARSLVEPVIFLIVMQDPFFRQELWRPELAEFMGPGSPSAKAKSDKAQSAPLKGLPGSEPESEPSAQVPTSPVGKP